MHTESTRMAEPGEVRARVERIPKLQYRTALKYVYSVAGRASEAVARASPSDTGTSP